MDYIFLTTYIFVWWVGAYNLMYIIKIKLQKSTSTHNILNQNYCMTFMFIMIMCRKKGPNINYIRNGKKNPSFMFWRSISIYMSIQLKSMTNIHQYSTKHTSNLL